ncbi:MAG: site-2 protease family protein [Sphaerobacter sp.]|nr:site-2 protease family protein [Sphaerobacter sp.]
MFGSLGSGLDGTVVLATLVAFVVGTTIHEFCHAWSALMLGDDTAQRQGRVTLNPVMHFDPIGFLGMALIAIGGFGIGWGRPVPINPGRLRGRQRGMALTALAGPLSNVVLATLFAIPLRFGMADLPRPADVFITQMVLVNLLLASFNLIPIPPLDGHKVLTGLLPDFWYPYLAPLERYGVLVLLLLIMLGGIGRPILSAMYAPVYGLLSSLILGPGSL